MPPAVAVLGMTAGPWLWWGRTAAGVTFSVALAFLFGELVARAHGRGPGPAVAAIVLCALYTALTVGAQLHWRSMLYGTAAGLTLLAYWSAAIPRELAALPALIGASLAAAGCLDLARPLPPPRFSHSRLVAAIHTAQGAFLFIAVLPATILWTWPRPFAAALIVSAFVLWRVWTDCPLTIAENTLRAREAAIPIDGSFTSHLLEQCGVRVPPAAISALLYVLGIALCTWWAIDFFRGTR